MTGPSPSTSAIHAGILGSSPAFGRERQLRRAIARKSTPIASFPQLTESAVALSVRLAPPVTTSTIVAAADSPTTQPIANIGPLTRARVVPSIRTTATIGIGLSATPTE